MVGNCKAVNRSHSEKRCRSINAVIVRVFTVADSVFPCQSLISLGLEATGCDICGITVTRLEAQGGSLEKNRLVIDHDHVTGLIRGLLCDKCNGYLGDYEKLIDKTPPRYIRSWRGKYGLAIVEYLSKPQSGPYDDKSYRRYYREVRTGSVWSKPKERAEKRAANRARRAAKRAAKRELEIKTNDHSA